MRTALLLFFALLVSTAQPAPSHASAKPGDRIEGATPKVLFEAGHNDTQLNPDMIATLRDIAAEQAQIWGDTILEGDYQADGNTQLDRIEGLFKGDSLLAYRIWYSERAWYTGECNPLKDRTRSSCQEGRIVEATLVWPSLREWTVDEKFWATFN